VESWVEAPLRTFVDDARVQLTLVLHPSGQVVAQAGFTRELDVMSACALASAIHASASALGKQLDGRPFTGLHHPGRERQLWLAPIPLPDQGPLLLLAVFDEQASLGLVQLYFRELCDRLAAAAPPPVAAAPVLGELFERELTRNLAALFGRI
jgi:hypothetical protein